MGGELTDKQRQFCDEYFIDFNGTQAAIRAGYSPKTANRIASENLSKPDIQRYLSEKKAEQAERSQITKDQLINELAKIAFFDIRNIHTVDGGLKSIHDFGDSEAAAIAGIETYNEKERETGEILGTIHKIKISPKIAAIERISKMLGYDAPTEIKNTGQVHVLKLPDNGRG